MIGFAGLTHLGLVSAAAAAGRGFAVVGFDPDPARAAAIGRAELPVVEPDLAQLIDKHRGQLTWTSDPGDLGRCDVVYVAADVPTDERGSSDLAPIVALIDAVNGVVPRSALLVVLSQVPPGFTRGVRRAPETLFYQVETLIFGRAVERALHPERFIVGCAEPTRALPPSLRQYLEAFGCPVLPMRYESAELAKISINVCLAASISAANTLAEVCEVVGADWSEIVPALRLDRRIGPAAYLAPGLGIAGGNIERDLATVCRLADRHGTDAGVVRAWLANSDYRRDWVLRHLHRRLLGRITDPILAVLGLAYKENTASTRNSAALALLAALPQVPVRAWDPCVEVRPEFHPRLTAAPTPLDACAGADAAIIMTAWDELRALSPHMLADRLRGSLVIDPHRVLDPAACRAAGLEHVVLGAPAPEPGP